MFNAFRANAPFLYPLKPSENLWLFSGGIEMQHLPEMG